jgi:hypothetical protein
MCSRPPLGMALGHLWIALVLFVAQLCPAEDGADHVVEVVRYAAGKLADGLEFLRLAQLPLHGAKLGDIFGDDFERLGMIRNGDAPHMQLDGNDPAVAAAPLRFRPVDLAAFPASR